jgi:hypothetical protein
MAQITRFVIDLITEEELSQRRRDTIAREMSEWTHLLGVETDDEMINVSDKQAVAHTHDATQDQCSQCNYHSWDSRNGDTVVEND